MALDGPRINQSNHDFLSCYTISTIYQKYVFGLSFLLKQGQDFLLEIHNHSRHTFSQ